MRDTRTGGSRRTTGSSGGSRSRGGNSRNSGQSGYQRNAQAYSYTQPAPRSAPSRKWRPTPAVGAGAVFLIVLVAAAIIIGAANNAGQNSYYSDTITAGIRINGTDYSGWDVDKLTKHLKDQYQKKIDDIEIKVTWQDKSWIFGAADLDATENVDEIVSNAFRLARVGSLEQRKAEAKIIKAEGRDFTVRLTLDKEKLKEALMEKTGEVAHPGHNASVVFNPSLVDFAIQNPPYDIEDFVPAREQIDAMFLVNPETAGKTVDVDMMVQKIMDGLATGSKVEMELLVTDFVPQVTEAKLRESFHLLNAYRTRLPSTNAEAQPRIDNIKLALSKFNGHILKPGDVLSFNETTGPRTEANGYKPAKVIGGDKALVDDYGGGVCQASTTIYNAALMAGCEILDRGHHSFPSSYAMKAFDAMVNWPNSDLKFKNISDGNMYIKAYVAKSYVYVLVFGKPLKDGMKITRETELVYEGPEPDVKIIIDKKGEYAEQLAKVEPGKPYVRVSGQKEARYKAYLVFWDANGNMIEKKELYEDHFREITREEVYSDEVQPVDGQMPDGTAEP